MFYENLLQTIKKLTGWSPCLTIVCSISSEKRSPISIGTVLFFIKLKKIDVYLVMT